MTRKLKKETAKKTRKAEISQESEASDSERPNSDHSDDTQVESEEKPTKSSKTSKADSKQDKAEKKTEEDVEIQKSEENNNVPIENDDKPNDDGDCDAAWGAESSSLPNVGEENKDLSSQPTHQDRPQNQDRPTWDRDSKPRRNFARNAEDPRRMAPREAGRGFGVLYDDRSLYRRRTYDDPRSLKRFRDERGGWSGDRGFDRSREAPRDYRDGTRDDYRDFRDGPRDDFRDYREGPRDGFRDHRDEPRGYPRGGYGYPRDDYRDYRDGPRDFRDAPRDSLRDSRDPWRDPRDIGYGPREGRYYPRTFDSRFDRPYEKPRKIRVENPDPSCVLGLFGTPLDVRTEDVSDYIQKNHSGAAPENIIVVKDRNTRKGKGFVFVYFKDIAEATAAKENLVGKPLLDRDVRVDFSISAKRHETPKPQTNDYAEIN